MKAFTLAVSLGSQLAATAYSTETLSDGKCRALILSGGSNNGASEIGAMWGLVHYGDPADFTWDIVSGVSAGGINAGFTAVWPQGSEVEMTEWMSSSFATLGSHDIWIKR